MIIKLPVIQKTWNEKTNAIERSESEIEVTIDTSFLAHLKWEEHFSKTLNCDLNTYTERVKKWIGDPNLAKVNFLGMLKLLYCYINSSKLPTFRDFVAMFDFEVADKIIEKIRVVLEEINNTASKN